MLQMIGNYRYSGAIIDEQKYSIVRNGDELQRVSKVFNGANAILIWDRSMPMTTDILDILAKETE